MSGFSAEWLALREPADAAARSATVTGAAIDALRGATAGEGERLAVDLGAGTGSNLRFLAPRLPGAWRWRLVDRDPALLARAAGAHGAGAGAAVECLEADLARLDDARVLAGASLVTASALLDLVSDAWLADLVDRIAAAGAAALFALSYDGRIACTPADPMDDGVVALVNAHQRTDKGFGPALGPDAARRASELFAARGYRVERAASDWRLGTADADLQRELIDGWARAAGEMRPGEAAAIESWRERRRAHVDARAIGAGRRPRGPGGLENAEVRVPQFQVSVRAIR